MGQYTEDEVNQALDAITNGMPIKRAGQVQEAKLAEWVRIQHALGVAPTHLQVRLFAERILHAMGDTEPIGKGWIQAFLKRNPSVKVQRSRPIDSRR
ncbi:transposase, partial [Colletotrichum higginsianum]